MAHNIDSPLESSMSLLTVSNKITKPQDGFVFRPMVGVDKDGETVRVVDMETEFKYNYFVLFFFPMDFKVDSSEVLSFKEHLEEFTKNHCEIVGVTSDSPLAVKRWISKDVSGGGFGGPVGFTILTDKDLSLSMSICVARDCGLPARATFIIDWTGAVRYMMVHRSDIGRSVKEILRLVQAFRHSDLTGEALASGWTPGGEVIPTDFTKKVEYFINKFGHGNNKEKSPISENDNVDDSNETPENEPAALGSEKVLDKPRDEKSVTKSKGTISGEMSTDAAGSGKESSKSEASKKSTIKSQGTVSDVDKSPVMSPDAATEASVKSPASTEKVRAKPSVAKSGAKSPLKAGSKTPSAVSVPRAAAAAEDEKKVKKAEDIPAE